MSTILTPNVPLDMVGAYIPPQRVTIFSIYPEKMEVILSRRAPVNVFPLEAGSPDNPALLVVLDTWESNATGRGNTRILAEDTARDVVEQLTTKLWEADGPGRAYPGIGICKGERPDAAEIADALAIQRRYFALLVNNAREMERLDKRKDIQSKHRLAGRELGVTGEKWLLDDSKASMKHCSWCAEWIDQSARKCPKCQGFQTPEDAAAFTKMHAPPMPAPLQPPVAQDHEKP
jgi:hypothetical protein